MQEAETAEISTQQLALGQTGKTTVRRRDVACYVSKENVPCVCGPRRVCNRPVASANRQFRSVLFLGCVFGVGLDGDFYWRAGLESDLITILILQDVFNANLPIEIVSTFDRDLCFLGQVGVGRLDDLFDGSGSVVLGFSLWLDEVSVIFWTPGD